MARDGMHVLERRHAGPAEEAAFLLAVGLPLAVAVEVDTAAVRRKERLSKTFPIRLVADFVAEMLRRAGVLLVRAQLRVVAVEDETRVFVLLQNDVLFVRMERVVERPQGVHVHVEMVDDGFALLHLPFGDPMGHGQPPELLRDGDAIHALVVQLPGHSFNAVHTIRSLDFSYKRRRRGHRRYTNADGADTVVTQTPTAWTPSLHKRRRRGRFRYTNANGADAVATH